jgi:hypothetical protein
MMKKVFESKAPIVPDIKAGKAKLLLCNPYKGEDGKWYYFDETSAPSEAFETKLDAQRALDVCLAWKQIASQYLRWYTDVQ